MIQRKRLRFVGVVLRKYRKKAQLTQERLASKLGISVDYLSRLERQKRHPSIEMLVQFAEAFSMKPGELLDVIVDMENTHNDTHTLPQHDEEIE